MNTIILNPKHYEETRLLPILRLSASREMLVAGHKLFSREKVNLIDVKKNRVKASVFVGKESRCIVKFHLSSESWELSCTCNTQGYCQHMIATALAWTAQTEGGVEIGDDQVN